MPVTEQDRHRSAGIREQLVRCELAHLRGGGTFLISDVHGLRVTVEVDPVGVDDDQLRAALADRLLDAQVDDRHVGLDVGRDDDDDARVIYLFDAHRGAGRRRDRAPPVHLHLGALQRAVEQAAKEEGLLIGDVLRKRDAELRPFALDPHRHRGDGIGPCRPCAPDGRRAQPGRVVDVGVVEATAVADPALVDLVVLVGRNPDQLSAALPLRHAAAHRAL